MILAALYLLWAYQRMFHGPLGGRAEGLADLNTREIVVMAPLLVLMLVIGFAPQWLYDRINPSVEQVVAAVARDPMTAGCRRGGVLMGLFAQVAQAPVATPDSSRGRRSAPELVLFGVGILVLMLDTAGRRRQQVSFAVAGVAVVGSAVAWYQAAKGGGDAGVVPTVAGLVALFGIGQFALTALWRDRPRMLAAILTASGFVGALVATGWLWSMVDGQLTAAGGTEAYLGTGSFLADMVAVDGVAMFTRITVCIAGLLTVPLGFAYRRTAASTAASTTRCCCSPRPG